MSTLRDHTPTFEARIYYLAKSDQVVSIERHNAYWLIVALVKDLGLPWEWSPESLDASFSEAFDRIRHYQPELLLEEPL